MLEDVKNDLEELERLISESSELYIAETDAEKERYGSGKIDTQIYILDIESIPFVHLRYSDNLLLGLVKHSRYRYVTLSFTIIEYEYTGGGWYSWKHILVVSSGPFMLWREYEKVKEYDREKEEKRKGSIVFSEWICKSDLRDKIQRYENFSFIEKE
ncbi:MAG: hypothetical protein NZ927_00320 [Candidatus Calescibacterium sp.]|nr:hypothetical protein [Candidatus Calescibacterium sp.]MCX7733815.1 hypothetical protein [bacterium]MDW8086979.1 hypothetical protein [Candidatus Calescibacterium sp.]